MDKYLPIFAELFGVSPTKEILSILILGSIFPVSALVYMLFQRRKRLERLIDDFNILGINVDRLSLLGKEDLPDGGSGNHEKTIKILSSIWFFTKDLSNFFVHSFLTAIVTILIAYLLLADVSPLPPPPNKAFPLISFLRYGFLGAYIFSIQLVYRRYTTLDLQPTVYMNCTITLISGLAFNFTAFHAIAALSKNSPPGGVGIGVFAIIAFSLGYFPLLAIRWFNRVSNTVMGNKNYRIDSLPLSIIDGISRLHETRLRDEGIDNVQNLAAVKIDELLMNTRFNAQQAIEWIDQAILYLYVDYGKIDSFRRASVRTISDFQRLWKPYFVDPNNLTKSTKIAEEIKEARQERALRIQSTPEYLDLLFTSTLIGPNVAFVESYYVNQKEIVKKIQEKNRKDEYAKSVVDTTMINIFQTISKVQYFEVEYRNSLGEIALTMLPPLQTINLEFIFQENDHLALAGYAWFADWLTKEKIEDIDPSQKEKFTKIAIDNYDKAFRNLSENPKLIYEIMMFCFGIEDINTAKEYATNAVGSVSQDNNFLISLFTIMLAWVYYQDNNNTEGDATVSTVAEKFNNEVAWKDIKYLKKVVKSMEETFGENKFPSSLQNLSEKIDVHLAQGPGSTIDSPPHAKVG